MAAVKSFVGKLEEKLVDTLFSDENYVQNLYFTYPTFLFCKIVIVFCCPLLPRVHEIKFMAMN